MKKAILTIGLFTLVLVSTSFASPKISNPSIADDTVIMPIDGNGGQSTGDHKKLDYNGAAYKINNTRKIADIDGNGGQSTGDHKKLD